jgi:hypothetical protein
MADSAMYDPWRLDAAGLIAELGTDVRGGLSSAEAADRHGAPWAEPARGRPGGAGVARATRRKQSSALADGPRGGRLSEALLDHIPIDV